MAACTASMNFPLSPAHARVVSVAAEIAGSKGAAGISGGFLSGLRLPLLLPSPMFVFVNTQGERGLLSTVTMGAYVCLMIGHLPHM